MIILVLAADAGVQPQTVEVIQLANEMNVPLIIAANKLDKFGVKTDTIKKQLMQVWVQYNSTLI